MNIRKTQGKHSERDELIFITARDEAIKLDEVFNLVNVFAVNELKRIRIDKVRENIILGSMPFMFEDEVKNAINKAKQSEMEYLL